MPGPAPVPVPAPPAPPPDPSVDITLDNFSDGDSILLPFEVRGKAVSRDGNNIASVSRQIGIFLISPLPDDSLPQGSSPWDFDFTIDPNVCPEPGDYLLTIRATKDGITYYLNVNFTVIV
jgi:hypothetical protein